MTNEGYNPEEIKLLREECEEEGMIYVELSDRPMISFPSDRL